MQRVIRLFPGTGGLDLRPEIVVTKPTLEIASADPRAMASLRQGNLNVGYWRRLWLLGGLLAILMASVACDSASAATYYSYDQLGRVTQAVETDGTTTQYTYDANGNVTSINRTEGTAVLSISSVSTSTGAVGSSITITGTGFSTILSQDIVTFDGVTGIVSYSNGNRLVVAVPPGASTGSLAVSDSNGSTSAPSAFTIVPVSISSFTPTSATSGAAVTVLGGGFDPTAGNNTVSVNGTAATVTSASATQLQINVPSAATPGHIAITTTLGTAVSPGYLIVPGPFSLSAIASIAAASSSGAGHVFSVGATDQVALALFDGTVGERVTLSLSDVSMAGQYQLFAPDGTEIANGMIANSAMIALPALPASGTYSFYLVPTATAGSATVQLQEIVTGTLPTDGTPTATSLAAGQYALLTFSGSSGASYSLALTNYQTSASGSQVDISVLNPDGSLLANCGAYQSQASPPGNCDFTTPASGTYTVQISPTGGLYSSSFNILLNQDYTATLTAGTPGTSTNVSLVRGQHAVMQFTAAAGQTLALYMGSVALTPSSASVSIAVIGPGGATVATGSAPNGSSTTVNLPNLAAGTYSALITPNNAASAPATMQFALANGVTQILTTDGSAGSVQTWLAGQAAYLSFAGAAGQNYGLALTGLTLSPNSVDSAAASIINPDGTALSSATCFTSASPGCQVSLSEMPQTGNYAIVLTANGQAQMNFTAVLSQDVTGTLSLSSPTSITLSAPGQNADMTFTVAAGQPVELDIGSLVTTPSGSAVIFYIYNSSGQLVTQSSLSASGSVSLGSLAPGTYTVLVAPDSAATANLQMTLAPGSSGALTNGTPAQFSTGTAGESATLTFNATAGQALSVALTNLSLSPASGGALNIAIYYPGGSYWETWTCTPSSTGCEGVFYGMPQTGTYTFVVQPETSSQTMSFTATAQTASTGTLPLNSPQSLNLSTAGQIAVYSFTTTAGQSVTLNLAAISTSPANTTVYANVYQSNGTFVTYTSTSSGATVDLNNLPADTYQVLIYSLAPVTTALQVTIGGTGPSAIPLDGSSNNFSTQTAGQNLTLTFAATAGQALGIALTNVSLVPSVGGSMNIAIYYPDGSYFENWACTPSTTGCEGVFYNLPETGTYTLVIPPVSSSQTMSLTVTAQQPGSGTLTLNTPLNVDLSTTGQVGVYSFTSTGGQAVELDFGSVATMPAGTAIYADVFYSNGSFVAYTSTTTGTTLNLGSLGAGTYNVLIYALVPTTTSLQLTQTP